MTESERKTGVAGAPRISVVLPVHNGARYLAEAVGSVRAQTFRDWELILVDDASSDDTPAIAAGFAAEDPRIRVLRNAANRKLPGSLNAGFALARGEYFTWTSDDNRYHPSALAAMTAVLDRHRDTGVVYTACDLIDDTGKKTGVWRAKAPRWVHCHNVVKACFLYRAGLHAELGGYDENRFLMEDWDFWIRAARVTRFRRIRRRLYDYRLHAGSLTATRLRDIVRAQIAVVGKALAESPGVPPRVAARSRLFLAMGAWRIGDPAEAARQMSATRTVSPLWYPVVKAAFLAYRAKKRRGGCGES